MQPVFTAETIGPLLHDLWEGVSREEIAAKYDCSLATITREISRNWKHLSPPGNKRSWLGQYWVYSDGRVWSTRHYKWLSPTTDRNGYLTLGKDLLDTKVHRLVLRVFDREPLAGELGRHLDGNPANNNIVNLRWGTDAINQHDRVKMGKHKMFPNEARYYTTKTYGHDLGLSACFRQWRAESHCHRFHGYPLSFAFKFGTRVLDSNGWGIDYGNLKPIKSMLQEMFDHNLLVALDDPLLDHYKQLEAIGAAQITYVPNVSGESLARLVFFETEEWLVNTGLSPRVWVQSVTCSEHEANSATYEPWVDGRD